MLEIESDFPCLGEACSPLRQAPEMTHGLPNSVANNIWQAGLIYSSLLLGGILHSSVLKVDVSSPEGRYQVRLHSAHGVGRTAHPWCRSCRALRRGRESGWRAAWRAR